MSPTLVWLFTLLAISVVLYVAEVFIPSHGVLSILATACMVVVVMLCFTIDRWLGVGALVALAILGPVGLSVGITLWQKTPVGRRMVLTATSGVPETPLVLVGTVGRAMTELRPMGECEFDGERVETRSEMGRIVPAGASVRVIGVDGRVATVRPIESTT